MRAVNKVVRIFLAGKHFESNTAGGGDHSRGFFRSEVARGDGVERQMHQDSQAADASAFLVDFRLRRFACWLIPGYGRRFHKKQYGRVE